MLTGIAARRFLLPIGLSVISAGTFISCGKSAKEYKIVDNFQLSANTTDLGDIQVKASADLNLGGMVFPMIEIPVTHNGMALGSVALQRTLEGANRLSLISNMSQIIRVQGAPAVLPNGAQLPIAGLPVMAVQAGARSRVYASLTDTAAVAGVAVVVKEFDSVTKYVSGVNLFYEFSSNGFRGIAGVFVGNGPGQNGIALFVDASEAVMKLRQKVAPSMLMAEAQQGEILELAEVSNDSPQEFIRDEAPINQAQTLKAAKVSFIEQEPSRRKRDNTLRGLLDISNKRTRLRVY